MAASDAFDYHIDPALSIAHCGTTLLALINLKRNHVASHIEVQGEQMYVEIQALELERSWLSADSLYKAGRTFDSLKIKTPVGRERKRSGWNTSQSESLVRTGRAQDNFHFAKRLWKNDDRAFAISRLVPSYAAARCNSSIPDPRGSAR